jgi:hypothetical protein
MLGVLTVLHVGRLPRFACTLVFNKYWDYCEDYLISVTCHRILQKCTIELEKCKEVVTAFCNGRRKSQTFLPFLRFILELVSPRVSQYRMWVSYSAGRSTECWTGLLSIICNGEENNPRQWG